MVIPKKADSQPRSAICLQTLELLNNRSVKLTLKKIAADTGLSAGWLSMFARGEIFDPGYSKLERLHTYLAKRS